MTESLTSVAEIGIFAYPWDILDRGPEKFIEECHALGVTKVHATTLYHSGKFLLPRNSQTKVYVPEPGHLFVPLAATKFPGRLQPQTSAIASSGWLDRLVCAASSAGIELTAWTVFHHSSALATKYPELAIHNVFGDIYPFALCPTHLEVRAYSLSLASAIQSLGVFGTLDLETIGYLGYFHGHHHEVAAVPLGTLETFLLSLCFCSACCAAAEQAGIAIGELRRELQRILSVKLNADDSTGAHPENGEQLLTLIASSQPLQQLIRLRLQIVTGLIEGIRSATRGMKLGVLTSSFVGSPSNIWMEGVSLTDIRGDADTVHLLAYSPDSDAVNSDLAFCLAQGIDAGRLNLTLNLGLPITPTVSHAMTKIDYAWRQGVRQFAFFNYGFLGKARLNWIQQISAELRRKESAGDGS